MQNTKDVVVFVMMTTIDLFPLSKTVSILQRVEKHSRNVTCFFLFDFQIGNLF